MIRVVCWNIDKKIEPWKHLVKMKENGEADLAILQEAGQVPGRLIENFLLTIKCSGIRWDLTDYLW